MKYCSGVHLPELGIDEAYNIIYKSIKPSRLCSTC